MTKITANTRTRKIENDTQYLMWTYAGFSELAFNTVIPNLDIFKKQTYTLSANYI